MKRYIYIIALAVLAFASCNRQDDHLFEQSAAERAKYAITDANEILTGAENGWEMYYFANTETRGYHFLIRFKEDKSVVVTAKNDLTTDNKIKTDSLSVWEMVSDAGPILSFNTYNSVLHAFSDPQDDGDGYLGDYEFLVLSAQKDEIRLKGKKHSGYSVLRPLEKGIDAEDYFAEVEQMQDSITGNDNLLELTDGNAHYTLHNGQEGIYFLTAQGEMYDEEDLDLYPFIATRKGIYLMQGFLDKEDERDFELKDGKLVGQTTEITSGNPADYFNNTLFLANVKWNIDVDNTNEKTAELVKVVNDFLLTKRATAKLQTLQCIYDEKLDSVEVNLIYTLDGKKNTTVPFKFDYTKKNNEITLSYVGPSTKSGVNVLSTIDGLEDLLLSLNGTYTFEAIDKINPTRGLIMTSKTDKAVWYNLTGTK